MTHTKMIRVALILTVGMALGSGCATLKHLGRVAVIETHEALDSAWEKSSNQAPAVVVASNGMPVIVASTPATVTTNSGVRSTPQGINAAYMDANGSSEECSIEPSTGLMVRYMVWCFNDQRNCWGWWMLSSVGTKHVRRVGGNLVADTNFEERGCVFTVRGFVRAKEAQYTEANPVLTVTGNVTPYDGTRQYVMVDCWAK